MPQVIEEQDITLRARLFRGLSDASRLAILEAVRPGPRSVGEIVEATGRSQSNVSNHLACLLGCGLVVREQRGRHAFYRLADARIDDLLGLADTLLAETARGVGDCPRCTP
ncbi:MAG TPA: metalloregulator ArsR/SmtB family transcription factor [Longimicrobiaceae bacterium]|nr:metalloregulator ArsR/SmtB family transcription factor [Longimicrobiaceae bacterium]